MALCQGGFSWLSRPRASVPPAGLYGLLVAASQNVVSTLYPPPFSWWLIVGCLQELRHAMLQAQRLACEGRKGVFVTGGSRRPHEEGGALVKVHDGAS